ncbi:MAG: hypothetical protein ACHBN1_31535 [Heteroscytonema crispum UTEX LB 1556]
MGRRVWGRIISQCPMPNVQCPMPNAQCPMPNAQSPMPIFIFGGVMNNQYDTLKDKLIVPIDLGTTNSGISLYQEAAALL